MDYKIGNICSNLGIGKSTIYKRLDVLKQSIPETDWKNNEYFYYTSNNKLFITEKGFDFIKNFKTKTDNFRQNVSNDVTLYQNQIIDIYKQRIEYLETENKRLLDIIAVKEQRELAKDVKVLGTSENNSFFVKFLNKFKKN